MEAKKPNPAFKKLKTFVESKSNIERFLNKSNFSNINLKKASLAWNILEQRMLLKNRGNQLRAYLAHL